MLRSAECEVIIDSPGNQEFRTSGDEVTGRIKLDVRRDLHVASIEAQMACEDRGRVYVSERDEVNFPGVSDLSAAHFDDMRTLWADSECVRFDLPESGILPKGVHEFPFKFRLPEKSDGLPGSYSVEANHYFNGIFWGVHATIDRESRTRPNYNAWGYFKVYPKRVQSFTGHADSFANATHKIPVKMSRRPSFLARSELQKTEVELEGRLSFPANGIRQSRKPVDKESTEIPEIRIAVKCDREGLVVVREVVLFLETTVLTRVDTHKTKAQETAIVLSRKCEEHVDRSNEWIDLSHVIEGVRVYDVPETCMTDIHDIKHTLRAQFTVTPAHKPTRMSYLEVSAPVLVLSEATVTDNHGAPQPPPPYQV